MRVLIFDENISGHHLEYLHHYYQGAIERVDDEFIFCLEDGFLKHKDKYSWPKAENVSFVFMDDSEMSKIRNLKGWKQRCRISKLIALKAKEFSANRVILTHLIYLLPFLMFFMPKGIMVRGIVYRIYLHTRSKVSKFRYAADVFLYWLMAHCRIMEKVFILNDQKSADKLNKIYHTNKFVFLADPVPNVDKEVLINLRSQYGIPVENKVFFHFGGLTYRKGTIEILKAINMSKKEDLDRLTFVFAGRIYDDMKDDFYELLKIAQTKVQILVFDTFCTYEFLYNMCFSIDVILMPYRQTEMSSGVLGYASVFEKPVIGPKDGLIGSLISDYRMGCAMENVDAVSIKNTFGLEVTCDSNDYMYKNDVGCFINTILS
ncbi:MAG: hypothetical protein MJZ33_01250 [Paludibacteraceae bacterium]|nr:hypothetical protein [Paludibacteraceae bacterium]